MADYVSMGPSLQRQEPRLTAVRFLMASAFVAFASVFTLGGFSLRGSRLDAAPPVQPASLLLKDTVGGPGAPLAKQVVVGMDTNINFHIEWNNWEAWSKKMEPYWTEDAIYDFSYVGPWDFGPTKGLRQWFDGEHMHFNRAIPDSQWIDFIRAATNETATSASYGLAFWVGEFAGVPPPASNTKVRISDLDFYLLDGNRIKINWCIVDVVDLFTQVGYDVLPPSPMKHEGYKAPNGMDGFPAPLSSMFTAEDAARSEKVWLAALHEDYDLRTGNARWWSENMTWYGPGGVGTAHSRKDYVNYFLKPLHAAFEDIERKTDLVVCEGPYCGAHFYLWGTHTGEWLGEGPTGKRVPIRCGAHAHIVDGQIVEGWLIIDVPLAFHAMGADFYARARAVALAYADDRA